MLNLFTKSKTTVLKETDSAVKNVFNILKNPHMHAMHDPSANDRTIRKTIELFINLLQTKQQQEIEAYKEGNHWYFKRVTNLKHMPTLKNADDLTKEIAHWPRIGSVNPKDQADGRQQQNFKDCKFSGFVREHYFNHFYDEIDEDVNKKINSGHLIEFKDNCLSDAMIEQNKQRKENWAPSTVLYKVDKEENPEVEVRGSDSMYDEECINVIAELAMGQAPIEDFDMHGMLEDE